MMITTQRTENSSLPTSTQKLHLQLHLLCNTSSAASPRPRQEDNNKQVSRWMTGRNKANALSVSFSEQKVVPITTKKKEPSTHRRAYHAALPQLLFMAIPYYSDARVTKFHYRWTIQTKRQSSSTGSLGTPGMKATEAYVQVIYFEILNEKAGRDLHNFIFKCTASRIHISQF